MPTRLRLLRGLALLPALAVIVGPFFVNRVTPLVFGMPFLLAWLVIWIVLTPLIMAVIYRLDPANASERE
jgi:tellurite resistance protein TehA-like permease